MRFIDVGCFNGDSVLHFAADTQFTEVLAFDPNDSFKDLWEAIERRYPQVKFYNQAVYTYNGKIKYTQRPDSAPLGSTINQDKRDWGMGEVREVECVDILDLIVPDTCLKLDGEGSEHDILERIIEHDKLKYLSTIYLEWHSSKMSGDYRERQAKIEEVLKREGKRIKGW